MHDLPGHLSGKALEALLEHIQAMIAVVKNDGALVSWNHAFDACKPGISQTTKLHEFITEIDRDEIEKRLASPDRQRWFMDFASGADEPPVHCDCTLIPLDAEKTLFIADRIKADSTLAEIVQRLNNQVRLFQVERDLANKLAKRKHAEVQAVLAQSHEISEIDHLTFLPNRRILVRELQDEALRAEKYHTQFSISIADVDHFKIVNDTYGHLAGDEVLRQIALTIREHIRHPDLAGRYGGEEFLILLPNSDASAAAEQAARLCRQIRETPLRIHEQEVRLTISIGIAQYENGVDTWESLLSRADTALYEAKNSGRDRWVVAD
jgi:diguanylate cyclase (GGDEF)-like protein